jgi:hypothetical protein
MDIQEGSVMLSNVKCFGTEDREAPKQIPAALEIYEYIIFKDAQIKSLNISNDQAVTYGMNPNPMNMMYNMQYPNFMGGPQSYYPMPMFYHFGNWGYNQMPQMNSFMNPTEEMKMGWGGRGFGPSEYQFNTMNNGVPNQTNPNEPFETQNKKDISFEEGGLNVNINSPKLNKSADNVNHFKVDLQSKPNDVQNKPNDVQIKLNDVQSKSKEQSLFPNDAQNKTNDTQTKLFEQKNGFQEKKSTPETNTTHVSKPIVDKKLNTKVDPTTNETKTNITQEKTYTSQEKTYTSQDKNVENKSNNLENKNGYSKYKSDDNTQSNYKKSNNNYQNHRHNGYSNTRYNGHNGYNGPNGYNGYNNNRYNNGNNYNNNYNKGAPRRTYNNNNRNSPTNEVIDIFESTKKFEKEKELAQIEAEFQKQREEGNLPEDLNPENAYDPTNSIYDNLSCEALDKKNNKRINKHERAKQLKEQEKLDVETFGASYTPYNNSDYNSVNNYNNRNYSNNKPYNRNSNYAKGPNPNHRQHNPRQQYTPKGQKKVFRVKNTAEE